MMTTMIPIVISDGSEDAAPLTVQPSEDEKWAQGASLKFFDSFIESLMSDYSIMEILSKLALLLVKHAQFSDSEVYTQDWSASIAHSRTSINPVVFFSSPFVPAATVAKLLSYL